MEDDGDDFSFDFESTLEEQQKQAASGAPSGDPSNIASAAVPVNQSSSSFKRNFRQVMRCIERTDNFLISCSCYMVQLCMLEASCVRRQLRLCVPRYQRSFSSRDLQMLLLIREFVIIAL
jgi:hypothetical protein